MARLTGLWRRRELEFFYLSDVAIGAGSFCVVNKPEQKGRFLQRFPKTGEFSALAVCNFLFRRYG